MNKPSPDMVRSPFCHDPCAAASSSRGFTILEVLVAVSIAGGVISLLVPALTKQVALGEQSNRLTAVEAAVSLDLDWFSNYARLWKLKTGSYPVTTDVTMTSSYTTAGAATYEPPQADCNKAPDSSSGLAASLLADGQKLYALPAAKKLALRTYIPPYEIKLAPSTTTIQVSSGGVSRVNVIRTVTPVGTKLRVLYRLQGSNSDGLNFSREASLLVEAAAWCDRLS
jgi:prepilin-type N-terminal cleavage/methylation domain-containing protein